MKPKVRPPQLLRIDYVVSTRADRDLVWKVFTDFSLWHRFSSIYGEIRWMAGKPWIPGSHLQIELVKPVPAKLDHVITACSPTNYVAWIDHAHGNTMEQWVHFKTLANGLTEVRTWAELMGTTSTLEGGDVRAIVTEFIRSWYDNFARECDRMAADQASCA